MRLADATWTEADAAAVDVALLPVGSTEQHGPHAPLGTDALAAETVAEAAADAYDGEAVVAPTVSVGVSEEHRQFTGTLWVSPDTFRAYVRETVQSLAHHGWTDVVVVNGHGGNVPALGEVCATISRHDDAYAVPFTWFDAVGEHSSEMGHAGPLETAFLRHTDPDLVREDRVEAARDGASERWGEWVSGTNLAHDSAEFSENGVVGDPAEGDAERGEELLLLATEALCNLIDAVVARETDRLPHR
ncbi:creatininase family protein [Halarchaeum sp. P4]|uniref:creatininase family protein n=1 Tax=Halarchaeum sp. P4 TaxID=3421639 RepID=UPI003EB7FBFC